MEIATHRKTLVLDGAPMGMILRCGRGVPRSATRVVGKPAQPWRSKPLESCGFIDFQDLDAQVDCRPHARVAFMQKGLVKASVWMRQAHAYPQTTKGGARRGAHHINLVLRQEHLEDDWTRVLDRLNVCLPSLDLPHSENLPHSGKRGLQVHTICTTDRPNFQNTSQRIGKTFKILHNESAKPSKYFMLLP